MVDVDDIAEHARDDRIPLRVRAPDDLRYWRTEATCLVTLAAVHLDDGRAEEARHASEQALPLWIALAASPRASPLIDPVLAISTQAQIGAALRELGRTAESRTAYVPGLAAAEARAAKHHGNVGPRADLGQPPFRK